MREAAAILKAGGLLPAGATPPKGEPTDAVTARAWTHPVLGARALVRLIPEALVPGADAEMQALGFGAPTPGLVVGRQRRRAPGFPGWALLNDPKNARYALEVVQDLKKAQRQAVSKPGHARDALVAVGQKLARTTPHFLPSYWEEAGRLFLGVGNHTYAAQSFEKAREAERQFALPVDEQARADAFLEFALAGALAAKSLVAYARSLSESKDKEQAYELFFHLCLRRTMGGVAPFSGMGKELRTLSKAAGRDSAAEDMRFLREALPSPAMGKAPAEAWKTWRAPLLKLCKEDAHTALRLVDLFPEPPGDRDDEFQGKWIELLREAGGFDRLLAAEPGRPAAWLRKLVAWLSEPSAFMLEVLRTLAPRLVADAVPVTLVDPDSWRSEIDSNLLELALELGVPLTTPTEDDTLDLSYWAKGGADALDLARIGADARFGPLIARSIDNVVGDEDFELAARGKPSMREARRTWLLDHVAELSKGGFPDTAEALDTLEEKTGPGLYAEFPEALEKLRAVDLAPLLARTLRAGVFDEYGWPALEKAWTSLEGTGAKKAEVELSGVYPWLVLHTDRKAVVVGPEGVVFSHDLKLPKGGRTVGFRYSGGQLLVVFRDTDYEGKGYWSGRPSDIFDVTDHYRFGWRSSPGALLPDGRVTEGTRALSPGDTTFGERESVYFDGTTLYAESDDDEVPAEKQPDLRRVDPRNGALGEAARPAFFDAFVVGRGDRRLARTGLVLLSAPAGLTSSPLGVRDGLVGLRARTDIPPPVDAATAADPDYDPDDEPSPTLVEVEGIDGRQWFGWVNDDIPDALIRFPGSESVIALTASGHRGDYALWSGAGPDDEAWRVVELGTDDDDRPAGTPVLVRPEFWHCLTARDPAGSAALRALTEDHARALLEGAQRAAAEAEAAAAAEGGRRGRQDDEATALPTAAVQAALPQLTHPGLVAGVAQQAALAADLTKRLKKLSGDLTDAAVEEVHDPDRLHDSPVHEILGRHLSGTWSAYGELSGQILAAAAHLAKPTAGVHPLPQSELQWMSWLGREAALVYLALTPRVATETDEDTKTALPRLLRKLADQPWSANPAAFRTGVLTFEGEKNPAVLIDPDCDPDDYEEGDDLPVAECWAFGSADQAWIFRLVEDSTDRPIRVRFLTNAPAGVKPEGATLESDAPVASAPYADSLRAAAEAAPVTSIPPEVGPAIAAPTGLSAAEATLLYAGLPVVHPYHADILGKPLREALGLKQQEASLAKEGVGDLDAAKLMAVFAETMPAEPARLLAPLEGGEDSPVARFTAAFLKHFGARIPLPGALVQAVEKLENQNLDTREFLTAVADPERTSWYTQDGRFVLDQWGDVEEAPDSPDGPVFDSDAALSLALYLCFAASDLPVGDPFRATLPRLLAHARARLANPALLIGLGTWYSEDKKEKKRQKAWFDSLDGAPWAPPPRRPTDEPNPPERGRDTGLLLVYCDEDWEPMAAWRPAKCRTEDDWKQLAQVRTFFGEEDGSAWDFAIRFLLTDDAAALAERAARSPLPAGAFEANPLLSAPEVVEPVRVKLGLDADAAALYLQTLALAQPTQKNVVAWNGWKPATYKKASEALAAAGLVVGGKRPRAGREHFLPGGWDEMSAPDLPLETWKLPLYGLKRGENGKPVAPLGQILPLKPVHLLFSEAWARIEAGDKPALEVVKTGRAAKREAAKK